MKGYLRASARRARRASSLPPSSTRTCARTAGPVGQPRNVEGASSTSRLLRIRFIFPAVDQLRMYAWSPTTTMFTGVPTPVPSRLNVVSSTVRCETYGSSVGIVRVFVAMGRPPSVAVCSSPISTGRGVRM